MPSFVFNPEAASFTPRQFNPEAPSFNPGPGIQVNSSENTPYYPDEEDFWNTSSEGYLNHPRGPGPHFPVHAPHSYSLEHQQSSGVAEEENHTPAQHPSEDVQAALKRILEIPQDEVVEATKRYLEARFGYPLTSDQEQATWEALVKLHSPPPPPPTLAPPTQPVPDAHVMGQRSGFAPEMQVEGPGNVEIEAQLDSKTSETEPVHVELHAAVVKAISFWGKRSWKI
ncbi:hypothetical protein DFH27DRAFT_609671 [Peziza echinospora]|nr:hypothetical protein DFH27DRAFT_609671 [Peziza echinospora]